MATAQEIVTAAFKAINAIDINEAAPSPAEMSEGLARLDRMVASWAGQGLAVADAAMTGDLTSGDPKVTVASTASLAPGLNISGTGVAVGTRVLSIDSPMQFTMTANATAGGTGVALAFTPIPFEARHEQGVIALLAQRLAVAPEDVPAWVNQDARDGWMALQAQFIMVPAASFDNGLVTTTQNWRGSQVILGG